MNLIFFVACLEVQYPRVPGYRPSLREFVYSACNRRLSRRPSRRPRLHARPDVGSRIDVVRMLVDDSALTEYSGSMASCGMVTLGSAE